MPLTSLHLTIDQRRPGWGELAVTQGTELLRGAGRAAMAAEVARLGEAGATPIVALAPYLRLSVREGGASPNHPWPLPTDAAASGNAQRSSSYPWYPGEEVCEAWCVQAAPATAGSLCAWGSRLLFSDRFGALHCHHLRNGSAAWQADLGLARGLTPAVSSGRVVYVTAAGELGALSLGNGELLWQNASEGTAAVQPAVVGGTIYQRRGGHLLRAHFLANGQLRWNWLHPGLVNVGAQPSVTPDGELLVAVAETGEVLALSGQYGRVVWRHLLADAPVETSAALGPGCAIVCGGEALHALDLARGIELWRHSVPHAAVARRYGRPSPLMPAVDAERVVHGDPRGTVRCLALETGDLAWQIDLPGPLACTPVLGDRLGLLALKGGELRCIRLEDGSTCWSRPQGALWSPPVITEEGVLLHLRDHTLVLLSPTR